MSDPSTPPIEKSGVSAAQGRTGTQIVKVLGVSIVLAVIVLFGLYAIFGTNHPAGGSAGSDRNAAAAAFHASPPAPVSGPPPATTVDQRSATH